MSDHTTEHDDTTGPFENAARALIRATTATTNGFTPDEEIRALRDAVTALIDTLPAAAQAMLRPAWDGTARIPTLPGTTPPMATPVDTTSALDAITADLFWRYTTDTGCAAVTTSDAHDTLISDAAILDTWRLYDLDTDAVDHRVTVEAHHLLTAGVIDALAAATTGDTATWQGTRDEYAVAAAPPPIPDPTDDLFPLPTDLTPQERP